MLEIVADLKPNVCGCCALATPTNAIAINTTANIILNDLVIKPYLVVSLQIDDNWDNNVDTLHILGTLCR